MYKPAASVLAKDSSKILIAPGQQWTSESIIIFLAGIIFIGIILYLAYDKWIISPKEKETKKYKENKYKNIDGC